MGSYVPTTACMETEIGWESKGVEIILMDDLNVRLPEPRDTQEEELSTVVAYCGLEDIIDHFMSRRKYRVDRSWTWRMRR